MEHTKGEWKVYEGYIYSDTDTQTAVIADLVGIDGDGLDPDGNIFSGNYTPTDEELLANMKLITNAPKLLEVCKLVLTNLKPKYSEDHLCIKKLKEVINKAEGN